MVDSTSIEDMMASFTNVLQPEGAVLYRCPTAKQLDIDNEVKRVALGLLKADALSDVQLKLLNILLNYSAQIRY